MEKSSKFILTPQRLIILEELKKMRWHPTADELYEAVRKHMPRISLGTVYRNLDMLCDQGIIQKVETSSFQKRFDSIIGQHYHLRCTKCGKLEDSHLPLITGLEEEASKICNYDIKGHNIEFFGICPDCK